MNTAYIGAVQLVDRQVLLSQFAEDSLNRNKMWDLVYKTQCRQSDESNVNDRICCSKVRVEFDDGETVETTLYRPK